MYEDFEGLPCIMVLVGKGRFGDTFPKSMRVFDLRSRYHTPASLVRSTFIQDAGRVFRYASASEELPSLLLCEAAYHAFTNDQFRVADGKLKVFESPLPSALVNTHAGYVKIHSTHLAIEKSSFGSMTKDRLTRASQRMLLLTASPQIGKTSAFIHYIKLLDEAFPTAERKSLPVRLLPAGLAVEVKLSPGWSSEGYQPLKEAIIVRLELNPADKYQWHFVTQEERRLPFPTYVPLEDIQRVEVATVRKKSAANTSPFMTMHNAWCLKTGAELKAQVEAAPEEWHEYHRLYAQQREKWRKAWDADEKTKAYLEPHRVAIHFLELETIQDLPVIADLGCGEAFVAQHVKQGETKRQVHSFDLAAASPDVQVADISRELPGLKERSVNIVVLCLSLMGPSMGAVVAEADRILKGGGFMLVIVPATYLGDPPDREIFPTSVGYHVNQEITAELQQLLDPRFVAIALTKPLRSDRVVPESVKFKPA